MADSGFTATPSKSPPILGASCWCLAGLRWAVADFILDSSVDWMWQMALKNQPPSNEDAPSPAPGTIDPGAAKAIYCNSMGLESST